jgi:hypothetical protein
VSLLACQSVLLFSRSKGQLFSIIADEREFEHLALVGLNHQDNPEGKYQYPDDNWNDECPDKDQIDHHQRTESDYRLKSVEADEFILFFNH